MKIVDVPLIIVGLLALVSLSSGMPGMVTGALGPAPNELRTFTFTTEVRTELRTVIFTFIAGAPGKATLSLDPNMVSRGKEVTLSGSGYTEKDVREYGYCLSEKNDAPKECIAGTSKTFNADKGEIPAGKRLQVPGDVKPGRFYVIVYYEPQMSAEKEELRVVAFAELTVS